MEITGLLRLRSLLFLERLEVLRTSENLGNHSIGPIFFCSVDHYRQNVRKDYWSRHETYVFGGKRSGAALIDTRPTCLQKGGGTKQEIDQWRLDCKSSSAVLLFVCVTLISSVL